MCGRQFKFCVSALLNTTIFLLWLSGYSIGGETTHYGLVAAQGHNSPDEPLPEFLSQLYNITVPQGRDVSFTCVVNNLGGYRVAWIKSDSKAILGIHVHMVSLNPRLSVTHNGHNTWKLHISHVQLNDSGSYMCQVNTDPMKSLSGYLDVVVPPDILSVPDQNVEENTSNEGGTVSLFCSAIGVPEPTVQWRREGTKDIILRTEARDKQVVKSVEGEKLTLSNIQRTDMGGYLCIASNGVPPSVSKRFDVHVNFPPSIKAINQLLVAPIDTEVTLECIVEVFPKPLNGWYRNDGNVKLHNSNKYNITEVVTNLYTWHMNLTIRHLTKSDFGAYSCSSVNALGKSDALTNLQELRMKITTTPTPHVHTTPKPRRKQPSNYGKSINEVARAKENHFPNQMQENDILHGGVGAGSAAAAASDAGNGSGSYGGSNGGGIGGVGGFGGTSQGSPGGIMGSSSVNAITNGAEGHTHTGGRNGHEKTHKNSGLVPSSRTPVLLANGAQNHRIITPSELTTLALILTLTIAMLLLQRAMCATTIRVSLQQRLH